MDLNNKDLLKINETLQEILRALNGSSITKDGGIVGNIKDVETELESVQKRIDKLERFQIKMVVIYSTVSASIAALMYLIDRQLIRIK